MKSPIPKIPRSSLGFSVVVVVVVVVVEVVVVVVSVVSLLVVKPSDVLLLNSFLPKKNANVVFLVDTADVVVVELIGVVVGRLKSLVLDVVEGFCKSSVVANSSVRLPS